MAAETLLALWNDTPTRRAIVDFVQAVSTDGSPGFVVPAERVAVFDNDGTLWSEKPMLVLHDDADREFAYTTGAEDALDRAKTHGWTVVSMKEDWSAVFASA
ncbi:MAG TPA: hypothetical protein VE888_23545 [Streptosporangiaceae bacterium]|jgi:hypothetical protein|nr:hypothetical protein [Streptosporangiaceae bacterium]